MEFHEKGYLVIRDAIDKDLLRILSDYLLIEARNGSLDDDGISRFSRYGDSLTEALLSYCQPIVERYTGKKVYPSYSYARVYRKGDKLAMHQDRPACEYSLTIPVSYEAPVLWPLFVMEGKKKVNIPLDIGDLLLYKGCDVPHGRTPFTGSRWVQVFLHYVDKKGKNAGWKYDKRKWLGQRPAEGIFKVH